MSAPQRTLFFLCNDRTSALVQVDDVLGDGFANAATAEVIGGCPKCGVFCDSAFLEFRLR
jgi:hypothetical protein